MKKINLIAFLLIAAFLTTSAQVNWNFDKSHTNIGFKVDHMVIAEVEGEFNSYEGTFSSPAEDNFEGSTISFTVDVNSINTDNKDRDNHLKSDDFFNAEKFPKITFKGKSMKKVDGKKYKLVGDVTMRDVTKEITLDVEYNGTIKDPWGNTRSGFNLEGKVNRFDYGLKWNNLLETGSLVVGEIVTIEAHVELIKQK